eukprot:scaffold1063_cov128-Isochrysis_galbana.AAC.3
MQPHIDGTHFEVSVSCDLCNLPSISAISGAAAWLVITGIYVHAPSLACTHICAHRRQKSWWQQRSLGVRRHRTGLRPEMARCRPDCRPESGRQRATWSQCRLQGQEQHAAGSPWAPMAPGASLEPAVAALRGRFQTKVLMSARTAKIKHLILESLYTLSHMRRHLTLFARPSKSVTVGQLI